MRDIVQRSVILGKEDLMKCPREVLVNLILKSNDKYTVVKKTRYYDNTFYPYELRDEIMIDGRDFIFLCEECGKEVLNYFSDELDTLGYGEPY